MIDKVFPSAALADVPDGATVMIGGFGTAGLPNASWRLLGRSHLPHDSAHLGAVMAAGRCLLPPRRQLRR